MAKAAFLFPGQGAQFVGMGQSLYQELPAARDLFDRASSVLGFNLLEVCTRGPQPLLDSTAVSQPAIYVASLAALELLKQQEPALLEDCGATAGLSLGEYTALTFSGAMDFETGLKLVQKRGQAMQEAADASSGGMVSVLLLDLPRVEELVRQASSRGMLRLANFLCPGNLVVSGSKEACDELEKLAGEAGARTVRLAVAGAFHTPMMQPAVEKLATALSEVRFAMPRLPVWANVTAKPYHEASEIPLSLARQVVEPVRWEETMRGMMESGLERFVEIGPGRVLAGLLKRINRKADCRNVPA